MDVVGVEGGIILAGFPFFQLILGRMGVDLLSDEKEDGQREHQREETEGLHLRNV